MTYFFILLVWDIIKISILSKFWAAASVCLSVAMVAYGRKAVLTVLSFLYLLIEWEQNLSIIQILVKTAQVNASMKNTTNSHDDQRLGVCMFLMFTSSFQLLIAIKPNYIMPTTQTTSNGFNKIHNLNRVPDEVQIFFLQCIFLLQILCLTPCQTRLIMTILTSCQI